MNRAYPWLPMVVCKPANHAPPALPEIAVAEKLPAPLNQLMQCSNTPRNPVPYACSDAAIAEASQNALAHVNARIEAQRRGRGGGSSGSGMSSSSSSSFGGGNGARAVAEAQIRVLAERHGIRVHILDEEHSSRVEQIRDLAREHGLQVQIVGEGAGEGGGGRQSDDSKLQEEFATGNRADIAAEMAESGAGAGAEETAEGKPGSGGTSTPPPVLSSLRPRSKTRTISPSSAPRMLSKVRPFVWINVFSNLNDLSVFVESVPQMHSSAE